MTRITEIEARLAAARAEIAVARTALQSAEAKECAALDELIVARIAAMDDDAPDWAFLMTPLRLADQSLYEPADDDVRNAPHEARDRFLRRVGMTAKAADNGRVWLSIDRRHCTEAASLSATIEAVRPHLHYGCQGENGWSDVDLIDCWGFKPGHLLQIRLRAHQAAAAIVEWDGIGHSGETSRIVLTGTIKDCVAHLFEHIALERLLGKIAPADLDALDGLPYSEGLDFPIPEGTVLHYGAGSASQIARVTVPPVDPVAIQQSLLRLSEIRLVQAVPPAKPDGEPRFVRTPRGEEVARRRYFARRDAAAADLRARRAPAAG